MLAFNGVDVQDENHLINLVSLTPIVKDQRIKVSIWRNGKLATLEIQLVDRTEKTSKARCRTGRAWGRGSGISD